MARQVDALPEPRDAQEPQASLPRLGREWRSRGAGRRAPWPSERASGGRSFGRGRLHRALAQPFSVPRLGASVSGVRHGPLAWVRQTLEPAPLQSGQEPAERERLRRRPTPPGQAPHARLLPPREQPGLPRERLAPPAVRPRRGGLAPRPRPVPQTRRARPLRPALRPPKPRARLRAAARQARPLRSLPAAAAATTVSGAEAAARPSCRLRPS